MNIKEKIPKPAPTLVLSFWVTYELDALDLGGSVIKKKDSTIYTQKHPINEHKSVLNTLPFTHTHKSKL